MFSKTEDVFKFDVLFKNDILFTELPRIRSHLMYSITKNMDIVVDVIKRQHIDNTSKSTVFNNGGTFFNSIQLSKVINQVTDEELYRIASTFRTSVVNDKYKSLCTNISDPVEVLQQFTKYIFIPVRLDYNTIPDPVKKNLLKMFLTTVFILSHLDQYITKFSSSIQSLEIYQSCYNQFFMSSSKALEAIMLQSFNKVDSYINASYNESNKLLVFWQTFNNILINISIEIINKFCPNYAIVTSINPKYDGTWVNPLDSDINSQIRKLDEMKV